jgi:hypothetical protein
MGSAISDSWLYSALIYKSSEKKEISVVDNPDFDFNFGGDDRAEMIAEAGRLISAGGSDLSGSGETAPTANEKAARLLTQLNQEVAEFGAYPDVIELKEEHFTAHGLAVPPRFKDLSLTAKFYWLRLPITLSPMEDHPFTKLECAVEFNSDTTSAHLRPKAHLILPDRKFQQLAEFSDGLELRIGENFEFEASAGKLKLGAGEAKLETGAGVDAKVAAKLGFAAGPFTYRVKKAKLDHSTAGTEKVFWRLADAEFIQENDPDLIVVLHVPREVKQVEIAAALQTYHSFNLWAATPASVLQFARDRVVNFFRKGAPARDTKVWDITPSL